MQFFEWYLPQGMLWKKLREEATALARSGITAVWIPPAYKGCDGAADVGYGVYDLWDLGEFDQKGTVPTKYGTKQELLDAVDALHKEGIDVYADIVLDHLMGADGTEDVSAMEVESTNRLKDAQKNSRVIAAWTLFTYPGRAGRYSDYVWHWQDFTGVDWDDKAKKKAIYLFDTKEWDTDVDKENGNFDYLMGADIDLCRKDTVDELNRWGKWFAQELNVDGFRLDAVKHMDAQFLADWVKNLRSELGREFFTVGEYWHGDPKILEAYQHETNGEFSLFDVPLHYNMYKAATSNGGFDMQKIFDGTLVQSAPGLAVSFVDNHDTQPGQALESFIPEWFRLHAYALILLREAGYPCVFYGDYYGLEGHPEFPPRKEQLDALLEARIYRSYGWQHDYLDDADVIGWTREGDSEHENSGLAVLLTNANGGSKRMYVGKQHAGKRMRNVLNPGEDPVVIEEDGNAVFSVPGGAVRVWTFEESTNRE